MTDVGGPLTIKAQNSGVTVNGVRNSASVTTSFATTEIHDIGGPLKVSDANGDVKVGDIRGDLSVDGRFGLVKAMNIRGKADIQNQNGGVNLTEIHGPVSVETSFGSVFLRDIDGTIDVQNQNGGIGIAGLNAKNCQPIKLRTTFSSIKVALQEGANYDLHARTSFGHISTDFPVLTRSAGEDTMSGTIGKGGCALDLITANGGITIEKE